MAKLVGDYVLLNHIGQGTYGVVHKAQHQVISFFNSFLLLYSSLHSERKKKKKMLIHVNYHFFLKK